MRWWRDLKVSLLYWLTQDLYLSTACAAAVPNQCRLVDKFRCLPCVGRGHGDAGGRGKAVRCEPWMVVLDPPLLGHRGRLRQGYAYDWESGIGIADALIEAVLEEWDALGFTTEGGVERRVAWTAARAILETMSPGRRAADVPDRAA